MSLKSVFFVLGCSVAWLVFLPLLVVGGGIALIGYAVCAEVGDILLGPRNPTIDASSAREMASRLCIEFKASARRGSDLRGSSLLR